MLNIIIHMDTQIPYLDKIIPIIVFLASPDKIILFGSYARGDNCEKKRYRFIYLKKGLKNGREIIGSIYLDFYENRIKILVDLPTIDYDRYIKLNVVVSLVLITRLTQYFYTVKNSHLSEFLKTDNFF